MNRRTTLTPRLAATGLALALVAAAVGCRQDDQTPLGSGVPTSGDLVLTTEVSSLTARPGDHIAVAIRAVAVTEQPLVGLQGILHFNPQQLRYLGQAAAAPFAIVNEKAIDQGALRAASLQISGLPARTATFVFEVTGTDYARGLSYTLEGAARKDLTRFTRIDESTTPVVAEDLEVPAAPKHLDLAAWRTLLAPTWKPAVARTPGQIVPNLKFGDVTLDGTIDVAGDAFYTANASVGNVDLISDPSAGARDVVVAGNVDPANSPGLGEQSDAVPPGREANGSRIISIFDASAIASAGVGIPGPIAGQLIPGRTTGAASDTITYAAGVYVGPINWTKNHVYKLTGLVRIGGNGPSSVGTADSEAVLNIEAGTRVVGQTSSGVTALFIQRNGQIFANGTAYEPVVMTCDAVVKSKGCWGGLFLVGNAHTNTASAALGTSPAGIRGATGGCLQNQGEGGAPVYGGCNDDDNSGSLKYLRVEYGGFILSLNNELNGITLSGVGRGTIVDYVQVHAGLDDGIEIFGGSLNLSHLYLTANEDDSFDNDFGWNGSAQFIIAQHDSLDSDKGTEVDNSATAAAFDNTPRTAFTEYNFTFYGKVNPASTSGVANNNSVGGMHIRRGARPIYRNGIVMKFPFGLDVDDAPTCVNINTEFQITNTIYAGNDTLGTGDADPVCAAYPVATYPTVGTQLEAVFIQDPANLNTVITVPAQVAAVLVRPVDNILPDFRPLAGSPALSGAAAAPAGNTFIQSVTYRGAVDPNGIPWYSGWTRGWQSSSAP